MKHLFLVIFLLISNVLELNDKSNTVSLKIFAEEAISNSIIDKDPIVVMNQYSAKIYSKIDLKHRVFNNLKREELFIVPKNTELTEELWGEQGEKNGAIVHKAAMEPKPIGLRYVLNGKKITKQTADTIDIKSLKDFIILKNRTTGNSIAFLKT